MTSRFEKHNRQSLREKHKKHGLRGVFILSRIEYCGRASASSSATDCSSPNRSQEFLTHPSYWRTASVWGEGRTFVLVAMDYQAISNIILSSKVLRNETYLYMMTNELKFALNERTNEVIIRIFHTCLIYD